jgi:hypothetical protein
MQQFNGQMPNTLDLTCTLNHMWAGEIILNIRQGRISFKQYAGYVFSLKLNL